MVDNSQEYRQNSHLIIHCPTNERTDERVAHYLHLCSFRLSTIVQMEKQTKPRGDKKRNNAHQKRWIRDHVLAQFNSLGDIWV